MNSFVGGGRPPLPLLPLCQGPLTPVPFFSFITDALINNVFSFSLRNSSRRCFTCLDWRCDEDLCFLLSPIPTKLHYGRRPAFLLSSSSFLSPPLRPGHDPSLPFPPTLLVPVDPPELFFPTGDKMAPEERVIILFLSLAVASG